MGIYGRKELLYTTDLEDHLFVVFETAYLIMQIHSLPSIHKRDTNFLVVFYVSDLWSVTLRKQQI
jgi:hypothetical protein